MESLSAKFIQELSANLQPYFTNDIVISQVIKIIAGMDTTIYSFIASTRNQISFLILRLFNSQEKTRAIFEYNTMKFMHENGINLPELFLYCIDNIIHRPYIVMEKINGKMLTEYLNGPYGEKYIAEFVTNLYKIHSIDYQLFPSQLTRINNIENMNKLKENQPFQAYYEWLHNYQISDSKLVLCHNDYHPNNIIIKPDETQVVIDWADIGLGDYRSDIGMAMLTLGGINERFSKQFLNIAETIYGHKIENIDYFIVVNIYKRLRFFSYALFKNDALFLTFEPIVRYFLDKLVAITNIPPTFLLERINSYKLTLTTDKKS